MSKQEIMSQLIHAVVEGDEILAEQAANAALVANIDAAEAIIGGLAEGMAIVGKYFEQQRYFLTEVVVASLAFQVGVTILKPQLKTAEQTPGVIVLGTVQGDTHDIGKNIVSIMMEAAGLKVYDLGRDVAPQTFVDKIKETNADVLGLSSLMTSSMVNMRIVIKLLEEQGIRKNVKVIIGGAPVSARYAREIGADAYSPDAVDAVRIVKVLLDQAEEVAL